MGVNGIYGLSGSGLDIESMVKVGMMSKQSEYDKMAQKYTKNEWTKTALIDLNNQITTFNMSSLTDYKLSANMNARNATSSNEAAVTATANSTAALMSHKVSVDALSSNAYLIGQRNVISQIISDNGNTDANASKAYLKDILFGGLTDYQLTTVTRTSSTATTRTEISYGTGNNNPKLEETINGNTKTSKVTNLAGNESLTLTKEANGTVKYTTASGKTITLENGTFRYSGGPTQLQFDSTNGISFYLPEDKINLVLNTNGTGSSKIILNKGTANESTIEANANGEITSIKQSSGSGSFDSNNVERTEKLITTFKTNLTTADQTFTLTKQINSSGTVTSTNAEYNNGKGTTYTGGSIDGRKITFGSGSDYQEIILSSTNNGANTVTVKTQEWGITGKIGNTDQDVSTGFTTGAGTTVELTDVAVAFRIGDGTGKETDVISYTYQDLLGDDTNKPKTINDLISDINKAATNAGLNVKAAYDNNNELFSLYNSKGGKENQILITAVTTDTADSNGSTERAGTVAQQFFNALGLQQSVDGKLVAPNSKLNSSGTNTEEQELKDSLLKGSDDNTYLTISELDVAEGVTGVNGKVTIDGVEYEDITDNKVTVGGVTYNILGSTEDANGVDRPATITVGQDVDAIVDKVKSFVESYNKILASLYEKYDEKPDSNYKPLTQSQKDQMKDEQIEKWENKAKQGLLYHDSTLSKIISQMRESVSDSVEVDGKKYSIFGLGISTIGYKGQLKLDEEKLRNAINEDGESVYNVFAKLTTTKDKAGKEVTDYEKSGIAQRLGDVFNSATKLIKSRAGSSADVIEDSDLNNLLRELQTKMSNFKKMMDAFEDKLYKKYDAMEVALSKLGYQLNFITGGQ